MNEGQRRLLKRGNWLGTEWVVEFTIQGCHITWPRWVARVSGVKFCHDRVAQIYNNNYRFVGPRHRHQLWHSNTTLHDDDSAPCYNEISGNTGKVILYNVVKPQDVGSRITLFGTQYGGQPLQEKDVNGNWVPGLTLTWSGQQANTGSLLVTRITSVTRDPTQGMAYLYEFDPPTGTIRDLAAYQPDETYPRYRRSKVQGGPCGFKDANGVCTWAFEALIKLAFIPVQSDRDFLIIDDFDALKYAMQAVRSDAAGDHTTAMSEMLLAVKELNLTDWNQQPDEQTPVRYNAVIGGRIWSPS